MKVLKNTATPCERIAFLERQVAAQQRIIDRLTLTVHHFKHHHPDFGNCDWCDKMKQ